MIETSATYFPELRRRMALAGVRPADLARALGHKHQALVGRWLAGQVKARAETLQAVEMAFQGLTATEGLPEPTPPEIGAPGGITEATEPPGEMFGPDIDWSKVRWGAGRIDWQATPATPPPSDRAE